MELILNSNDIHEVLKISKGDDVNIINNYIVANDFEDNSLVQVIKKTNYDRNDGQTKIDKKVLKLVPEYTEVKITEDTILADTRKIEYALNNSVDEPIEVENYLTTIKSLDELKSLLTCKYAISKDLTRIALHGICIQENQFAACDGFRLAVREGDFKVEEQVIISSELANRLNKIKKYKGEIKIYYNDRYVKFEVGDLSIIGTRIDGEFLEYDEVIPKEHTTRVEIETKDILDILKDYKKNKFELIKFDFQEDKLIISSSNKIASVEDSINIKLQGEPLNIQFNVKYLIECLKNYDVATLELSSRVSAMIIKEDNKLDLVLPVRLKKY